MRPRENVSLIWEKEYELERYKPKPLNPSSPGEFDGVTEMNEKLDQGSAFTWVPSQMEIKKTVSGRVNGDGEASSVPWQRVPTRGSEGN